MRYWTKGGLEVRVLYSAAAVATQILVSSGQCSVLVDAGDGALRDLLENGFEPERLKGILLTHGHYDHVGGLHTLLGYMKMRRRNEMLYVFAPDGCEEAIALIEVSGKKTLGPSAFTLDLSLLRDGDQLTLGHFRVKTAGVKHAPEGADGAGTPMPALGYRIGFGETTVAVTGDCCDTEAVRKLVTGADLALVEASFISYSSESEKGVHLTEELATEIGQLAKEHILIHRPLKSKMKQRGD